MVTEEQVAQYYDQGYFIADQVVDDAMVDQLEAAVRRAIDKVHRGEVVDDETGIGRNGEGAEKIELVGLLAPEFEEPVFGEYLASDAIAEHVRPLIGNQLRLGWVHAFIVQGRGYTCRWHRDFGQEERHGSEEVELEILGRHNKNSLKWHMALVDDPCLWLVPTSQRRYRTDLEDEVLLSMETFVDIPKMKQIDLKRGQTIFWSGNTIHRAFMPEGMKERVTLLAGLKKHDNDDPTEPVYDRHRWRFADNVRGALPSRAQEYYDNWRSVTTPS